jgi:arylsulfatase A-like enzyme
MEAGPCLTLMPRRLAMLVLVLVAALSGAAESRPNIVLVVGEDMGPDTGAYGCKDAITPNMDRLAREGARFTRAYTHAGVCAPSRSGMVTGQYP